MKTVKLLLAALVLCASQSVFAASPAEQAALDSALAAVSMNVHSQSLVDAAVQAAANAGISEAVIVTQLYNLGVPANLITAAMSANISLGSSGVQPACAPSCAEGHATNVSYTSAALNIANTTLALLSTGAPTGAGGAGGLASLGGGFMTGGFTGGPNGAVSRN